MWTWLPCSGLKGDPDFKAASAFDPAKSIDKLTQRKTLELANGPALLPKATRGSRVQAQMLVQFGNEKDLLGQRVNSSAAADLIRGVSCRAGNRTAWTKLPSRAGLQRRRHDLKIAMSTKGREPD